MRNGFALNPPWFERNQRRSPFLVLLPGTLVAALIACSDSPNHATPLTRVDECPNASAGQDVPGDVITIREPASLGCVLEFREFGIELRGNAGAKHPDPGRRVVKDTQARFYAANAIGFPGVITMWDSSGVFLRTIGRPGQGPGELNPRGALSMFVDSLNRLHVRDGGPSLTTFSAKHEFEKRVPWSGLGGLPGTSTLLADGTMLVAQPVTGRANHYFHVIDIDKGVRDSFGEVRDRLDTYQLDAEREIAYAGGTSFWAGPVRGDGRGYELELWSTNGRLHRVLRREATWFPRGQTLPLTRQGRPPPAVGALHLDNAGLLIAVVVLPNDRWRWIEAFAERQAKEQEFFDAIVDVIDTRSALLLASVRYHGGQVREIPRFIAGTALAYRSGESEDGTPKVIILKYHLLRRL